MSMPTRNLVLISVVVVATFFAWRAYEGAGSPDGAMSVTTSPVQPDVPAAETAKSERVSAVPIVELVGEPITSPALDTPPWEVDDDMAGIAQEQDELVSRRRILTHCLHEFRRERERSGERMDPTGIEARELQYLSLASILDSVGRGYEEPPKYKIEAIKAQHGADHFYVLNKNYYAFKRGEFPEFDQIVDLQLAVMADAQKSKTPLVFQGMMDEAYFDALEVRAVEALSILYSY